MMVAFYGTFLFLAVCSKVAHGVSIGKQCVLTTTMYRVEIASVSPESTGSWICIFVLL